MLRVGCIKMLDCKTEFRLKIFSDEQDDVPQSSRDSTAEELSTPESCAPHLLSSRLGFFWVCLLHSVILCFLTKNLTKRCRRVINIDNTATRHPVISCYVPQIMDVQ